MRNAFVKYANEGTNNLHTDYRSQCPLYLLAIYTFGFPSKLRLIDQTASSMPLFLVSMSHNLRTLVASVKF